MAIKLFGFTILSPRELLQSSQTPSVVPPQNDQGAATVYETGLGVFGGSTLDMDAYAATTNEIDLINQYRDLAMQPEVDEAIGDIINEMIVREDDDLPLSISVDALPDDYTDEFRQQVLDEFDHVMNLLEFKDKCYDIARQFYVDGRLYYDLILDETNPTEGIVEIRNIDPRTIRPVREMQEFMHIATGARITDVKEEYFVYNPQGFRNMSPAALGAGTKITKDRVAYINSGLFTPGNVMVLSHLHKAIKPFNQLRMVEDATVIYRITRAPERRVFYIDVGDLPTNRAEQYLQSVASRYRNKVVYDSTTGEVRDDRKVMSMLEDFFLPRRSSGRGSEIQQLQGGQNLGEMQDVDYFKVKLYRALNVPLTRIEPGGGQYTIGRAAEITRDEIKFSRFLSKQRARLSMLFDEILSRHLTIKGIIHSPGEWQELRKYIRYEFVRDSHFTELKDIEVMTARVTLLDQLNQYVGKFVSEQYVRDRILRQTSEEQQQIREELKQAAEKSEDGVEADTLPSDELGNVETPDEVEGGGEGVAPEGEGEAPPEGEAPVQTSPNLTTSIDPFAKFGDLTFLNS